MKCVYGFFFLKWLLSSRIESELVLRCCFIPLQKRKKCLCYSVLNIFAVTLTIFLHRCLCWVTTKCSIVLSTKWRATYIIYKYVLIAERLYQILFLSGNIVFSDVKSDFFLLFYSYFQIIAVNSTASALVGQLALILKETDALSSWYYAVLYWYDVSRLYRMPLLTVMNK